MDARDVYGMTPLMWASAVGHVGITNMLLEHGADVNARLQYQSDRVASLVLANDDSSRILLTYLRDVDMNETPLMLAIEEGHWDVAKMLIQRPSIDVNAISGAKESGLTVLAYALKNAPLEVIVSLLDRGADANYHGGIDENSLFPAVIYGRNDAIRILCDHKADINRQTSDTKTTPLIEAARSSQRGLVAELVRLGADANLADNRGGWTALMYAAKEGDTETAKELLGAGAKIEARNFSGQTALDIAQEKGFQQVIFLLETRGIGDSGERGSGHANHKSNSKTE